MGIGRALVCFLVVAAGSGCGGCAGLAKEPAGPIFTITEPGTGAANSEPLVPMQVGSRLEKYVVDGLVEAEAGPLMRLSGSEETFVVWYFRDERGLFAAGSTDQGILRHPQLIAPAQVRLGMKWETGGESNTRSEITGREARDTVFGRRTVWRIHSTPDGETGRDYEYIEGRGPLTTRQVVLDPLGARPPARRWLSLDELPGGGIGTLNPSMIRLGEDRALLVGPGFDYRNSGFCAWFDGTKVLEEAPPKVNGVYTQTPGPACVFTAECHFLQGGVEICGEGLSGHASAVWIAPDGTIAWLARGLHARVAGTTPNGLGIPANSAQSTVPLAIVSGAAGKPRLVYQRGQNLTGPMYFSEKIFSEGNFGNTPEQIPSPWEPLFGIDATFGYPERVIALPETGGGTGFLILTGGVIWTSRLDGTAMSVPKVGARLSGKLSVLATDHGTEVLRVTVDGQVDRLAVDGAGSLVATHLADVQVGVGEAVVGAWRWRQPGGDRLVVSTLASGALNVIGRLYKSRENLGEGVPLEYAAPLKLVSGIVGGSDGDPFVCWPAAVPSPAPNSIRVGGAASTVEVVGNSCAVLALPPYTPPTPMDLLHVEATFGVGMGRVALIRDGVIDRGLNPSDKNIAALTGGGFVTPTRLYDSGGLRAGSPPLPLAEGFSGKIREDLKGNGLWLVLTASGQLRRIGRTSIQIAAPDGFPITIRFTVAGGGVVVTTGATPPAWAFVHSDGTWTPLAAPAANQYPCTRLADGTMCGSDSTQNPVRWYCQAPSSAPVIFALPGQTSPCQHEQQLGVGEWAATLEDGTVVFKGQGIFHAGPNGVTTLPYVENESVGIHHAADGTAWGGINRFDFMPHPVRFTATGLVELKFSGAAQPRDVMADTDVLIGDYRLRAPRPR